MAMYKEYADLYHTYTQKYGPKTAIFLMVGSFYELYDIQNNETGLTTCNVREITDYLGIQLSVKKADISEHCDGLFAGFPDGAVHKWAGRLTSAGWTVVVVDQEKDFRGKVKARKVSRILSPSTHLEHMSSTDIPYIVTLYFHAQPGQPPACGAGALDLTTGTTRTYTGQATGRPDLWTADDVVQFISVFPPKEIWIGWYEPATSSSATQAMPSESHFRRLLGQPSVPLHLTSMDHHGAFSSELARSEYLQRCYGIKSLLPPVTYLGLRSLHEEMALLQLLHFVEEHHPSMLHSFHRNEPWIPHQRLICGNHALTQLQLAGPCLKETVMGLFDKCITSMGKRAIQERLMSPYSDAETIRKRLEEVTDYHTWPTTTVSVLERQLRFMFDLPRLHRKILCGTILPVEIAGLFQTYTAMNAVRTLTADTHLKAPLSEEIWEAYHAVCHTHWDQEKAQTPSADMTPLNGTQYPAISRTEQQIQDTWVAIHAMRREIATAANLSEDAIRVEEREKEPFGFKGSTITLQQLKKNQEKLPDGITFSLLKSGGWIDGPLIQQWNTALQKLRDTLANLYRIHAVEACLAISEAGRDHWTAMEQWICHVDGTQCIGRVSLERGFSCPEVEDANEREGSAVELQHLRHPLVEATASRAAYVTHTVSLGYSNTNGWLIYGMNASGKSTLMKATGLCILLAQAGCFVPATRMRLRPFRAIYTRILNQDNLFAGLSSFAVEMSELRDILRHADPYALVLGDELCSGTESISAQALVASGIQWLATRHAKCMFATHLHGIPDLLSMKEHKMEVWHLHVEYDAVSGRLLYDRSLRPGKGSSLYGLEVARAMDLPFEFMEQAVQNRHRLMGTLSAQEAPTSSWNRQIVRKQCERCMTPIQSELEVHHVQERHTARHGILPDGTPMNDPRNLMVLCQTCHDAVHANHVEIGPIRNSSEGPVRIMYETSATPSATLSASLTTATSLTTAASLTTATSLTTAASLTPGAPPMKGKWSAEERQTIMDTLRTYSSMSFKSLRAMLDAKYDIQISESMLGKMRREAS